MKEVWREIRESLDIGRFVGSFRDRWVWLAFLLGGIGLLFPSGGLPPLWRLAFAAMTEELAYRALLQRQLEQCVPGQMGAVYGRHVADIGPVRAFPPADAYAPHGGFDVFPFARLRGSLDAPPLALALRRRPFLVQPAFFSLEPVHIPYMRIPARLRRRTR